MEAVAFNMMTTPHFIIEKTAYRIDDVDAFVSKLMDEFSMKVMDENSLTEFVYKYSHTIPTESVDRIIEKNANEEIREKVIQHYINICSKMEAVSEENERMIEAQSILSVRRNIVFVILNDIARITNIML